MKQLRVALVGCGGVARRYRKVYAWLPGVSVTTAIDVNLGEAEAAARETSASRISTHFEDALGEGIDVVVISTPNFLHQQQAVAEVIAFLASPEAEYITGQIVTLDGGASAVGCYSFETYKRQAPPAS